MYRNKGASVENLQSRIDQLLAEKPSHWEYILFDYCLTDAIDRQLTVQCQAPSALERAGSKFSFYLSHPAEVQKFYDWSVAGLNAFVDAMKAAIRFRSEETTECFGPPGVPGNPALIAQLAKSYAQRVQVVRQCAFNFEYMRVVCEDAQKQVMGDLYLGSALQYIQLDCQRSIEFIRSLGALILEAVRTADGKLNLSFKTSSLLLAHEPLIYQFSKVLKPAAVTPNLKTIGRSSIHVTFVDTETTGLDFTDEPISVGAIKYEVDPQAGTLLRVIDTYYELREPSVPVGESAYRVHGLGLDQLRGKRWDMQRVQGLLQADLVIAHNADFDMGMLAKLMKVDTKAWACTMKGITDIWGRRNWISLDDLADRFDLERPSPHNALIDAKTVAQVVAQPLPHSTVRKTILWEIIRRHYGFESLAFNNDDYIVWGHYTPNGTLLYVWTARSGEPSGPDSDFFLNYYIEKHLPRGCVVVPIKGDLTYDQALEAKDELLKEHHASLLNVRNIHRPLNQVASGTSNEAFYTAFERGRWVEKTDVKEAVSCYETAMRHVLNSGYQRVESGLIGQIQEEAARDGHQLELMLLKPLDRITLLHCRQGAPDRALGAFDEAKAK